MSDLDFIALLDQIYDAALRPEAWALFLETLAEALHGKAVLFMQDSQSAEASLGAFTRFDPSYIAAYLQYFSAINIWQPAIAGLRPGELLTDEAIMTVPATKRTAFYNDWLRPQDLLHGIGLMVQKSGTATTQLSVLRSERAGAFSASEVALIQRLSPHVGRAVQLHRTLAAAQVQRDCLLQGLEGAALGVMIVDHAGTVSFANAVAEQVLRRGAGLIVSHGRLRAIAPQEQQTLARLVHEAAGCSRDGRPFSSGLLALPNRDGGRPLSLLVVPLHDNASTRMGLPGHHALIFINDPEHRTVMSESDLGHLYGLTAAEAKLLQSLLAGTTLADYAASARITINTAKTHLNQIFAKTGRNRQSDVIRDVLENPIAPLAAQARSRRAPVRSSPAA